MPVGVEQGPVAGSLAVGEHRQHPAIAGDDGLGGVYRAVGGLEYLGVGDPGALAQGAGEPFGEGRCVRAGALVGGASQQGDVRSRHETPVLLDVCGEAFGFEQAAVCQHRAPVAGHVDADDLGVKQVGRQPCGAFDELAGIAGALEQQWFGPGAAGQLGGRIDRAGPVSVGPVEQPSRPGTEVGSCQYIGPGGVCSGAGVSGDHHVVVSEHQQWPGVLWGGGGMVGRAGPGGVVGVFSRSLHRKAHRRSG